MFKAIGDFIHRTPWWAMVLLGFSVLLLLVAFSAPVHVLRLSESGATPQERQAIKREIDRAFGDNALNIAENIVEAIKDRSADPARKAEMERALSEIAQARKEIFKAQRDATASARDAMREAQNNAIEAAVTAAEGALDGAREAREAVEEAKSEAADKLKSTGADSAAALAAFDEMIKTARAKEAGAREALKKLQETRKRGISIGVELGDAFKIDVQPDSSGKAGAGVSVDEKGAKKKSVIPPPDAPGAPNAPGAPGAIKAPSAPKAPQAMKTPGAPSAPGAPPAPGSENSVDFDGTIAGKRVKGNINIDDNGKFGIHLPALTPMPPLPPELREDIKSGVASDVRRIGIGSAMVLAFIPIFIMMLIAKYFIDRSRRAQAFAEQKKQEADVSNVHRQVTEARLQALQAQVEPHFLYNTLANVQALTEVDPAQANQMTGHLIQYLRSSLPKMRENTSTVGQELELVRAYLNILKMRMGARLEFDIDCPADLMSKPFPPMMLPSLVENAIKHGLEPQKEGGRIDVIVMPVMTAAGERIRVLVRDTGRGLTDAPVQSGGGVGLSNIRERLIALYGDEGKLTLESNDPKGVIASIEIPAEPMVAAGTSTFNGNNGKMPSAAKPPIPKGWWGKTRYAIATTHGVWAKIMSTTFVAMMIGLAIIFGLAIAGLYTGLLPMNIGNSRIEGLEGMALGTLMLIAIFGVVALILLIVVGVLYGLGLLFAGLLIIIPLIVTIAAFPALAPFIVIGFLVYWFWFRKRRKSGSTDGA